MLFTVYHIPSAPWASNDVEGLAGCWERAHLAKLQTYCRKSTKSYMDSVPTATCSLCSSGKTISGSFSARRGLHISLLTATFIRECDSVHFAEESPARKREIENITIRNLPLPPSSSLLLSKLKPHASSHRRLAFVVRPAPLRKPAPWPQRAL